MFGHTELTAYGAHFIFKQKPERFAELQIHIFGQAAYVVVALDNCAGD